MPSTVNLGLEVQTTGTNVGTWGTVLNNLVISILDACFGSVTTKSLTNANVTLSTTESQAAILRFSGTLSGNVIITLGAVIKTWTCENNCLGAFTITMKGSPGTGNVVGLPPGSSQIYWDGTNVNFVNLTPGIGGHWDYAGATVPAWVTTCTVPPFLLEDGSSFSAVTYPILNMILGGTTLPDARGRNRIALDGGTGRVTTAGSGVDGSTRFAGGGAQNITLDTTMIPAHVHPTTDPTHQHTVTGAVVGSTSTIFGFGASTPTQIPTSLVTSPATSFAATGITVNANTGGGGSHNNMAPVYVGGIVMMRAA